MIKLKLAIVIAFVAVSVSLLLFRSEHVTGQTGTSALSAPTGVSASDTVYNNKVAISWNTIRGATSYRVFRNAVNDPTGATDIGTSVTNTLLDSTTTAGQTFFYWVRAENSSTVSDLSTADQGTRSTTIQQGPLAPLDPPPPAPPANPLTATKAALGKVLFWDEQLSSTRTVSCGSCHHSGNGGTDPRSALSTANSFNPGADALLGTADDVRGSLGVPNNNPDGTYLNVPNYGLDAQVTGRKTVSYVNAVYSPLLFWDGRATGQFRDPITNAIVLNNGGALESQSVGPPTSTSEMGHNGRDWNDVAARVTASKPLALSPVIPPALSSWVNGRSYPELFQEAFGTSDVTPSRIALAIASFERTLYSDRAPIDLDAAGIAPLTGAAQRGRGIFNANGCNTCHAGSLFSDNAFHYIGVRPQTDDTGRFQVTGNTQNLGEFRTPSLRNVALRGSYFHNGQFTTLNQVVAFYNRGGDFTAPNKPPIIHPLGLNAQQQSDLVAFLGSLTDPRVGAETAPFDRPILYTESGRVPVITGALRAGSGGFAPQIKAISPPIAGNPNFTVSVSSALGNAAAVLVIDSADPGVGSAIPASGSLARISTNTQNTGSGNGWVSVSFAIPNDASLIGKTFFARWYITDPSVASGFSVSQAAQFTVFGDAAAIARSRADFDGDGKTDLSVYRPSDGNWYVFKSGGNVLVRNWGVAGDVLTPGDFDGDGKTDTAAYRPSSGDWYILRSSDSTVNILNFGIAGDRPVPGDYDGDGKTDVAQFRPSEGVWYVFRSSDNAVSITTWGEGTDLTVPADYDGDGKTDVAVFRPSTGVWYVYRSTAGPMVVGWGVAGDKPVEADYDGDGKDDVAVYRPSEGNWYVFRSSDNSVQIVNWGNSTDVPSPGDFDGDGKDDFAVFRDGTWFAYESMAGPVVSSWGVAGDTSIPSKYFP